MNLFGVMDISASALQAERVRAEVVAANMANAETTRTEDGGPYRRQHVVFQQSGGDGFASSLLASGTSGAGIGAAGAFLTGTPRLGSSAVSGGVEVAGVLTDLSAPL